MVFSLIIVGAAFLALDLLAYRFGVDTRHGCDWRRHDPGNALDGGR
jgi:hypothetical protein